ncbi:MAG: hypothetical protein FJ279_37380, partial [Planctomycetes bacterium]|nr:hypothetical protein [Planctomycetota bacterium]
MNAEGGFSYRPNADWHGTDTFTYRVSDGTASAVGTVTITVNAVNDAPCFTKGADQMVNEDAGPQTVAGWATGLSAGPANESGQSLSFVVSNDNNGLFAGQPAVAADGALTYTPAANAYGAATVTVKVQDDGGTANGGQDTSPAQTFTITVIPGSDIEGLKWEDLDADGVRDAGEAGLAGWTVYLDQNNNGSMDPGEVSAVTDANGAYAFADLQAGSYVVREAEQAQWLRTAPPSGSYTITLTSGQTVANVDFGNVPLATIEGRKWNDADFDGVWDTGESPLEGWTIYLDMNGDSALNTPEPWAVTDHDGRYALTSLLPGDYRVGEVLQSGWTQTAPATAFHDVTLTAGQVVRDLNFGNAAGAVPPGGIEGWKWNDLNLNGAWDASEPAVSGWKVFLDANRNGGLDSGESFTLTDDTGLFAFTNVAPGSHRVAEVMRDGWSQTAPAEGFFDVFVTPGRVVRDLKFGNVPLGGLQGWKWEDLDDDGVWDTGERGLADWTIFLDQNRNGLKDADEPSAVTDTAGQYAFRDLAPGHYHVAEVLKPGWAQS